MARGVQAAAIDPSATAKLFAKLGVHWGQPTPQPAFFLAPGQHANHSRHLMVVDGANVEIGLKAADRMAYGTKHEVVAAQLARRFGLPLAPDSHLIQPVAGLGPLADRPIVATRWHPHTEALDKLGVGNAVFAAVQSNGNAIVNSFGQWFGFGLAIGARDRNAGNWICSADGRSVGMIDLEDSFVGEATLSEFIIPLDAIKLYAPLKAEPPGTAGGLRESLDQGLRKFYRAWVAPPNILTAVLANQAWGKGYTNRWWPLTENLFVTDAVTGLQV